MLSKGELATLEAHGLIRRVDSDKSKRAFDLICGTVFDSVHRTINNAPGGAGMIPTEKDCSDFLETVLEDDPLWQHMLLKHCASVNYSMTKVLTEIMARYLIDSRYSSLVARVPTTRHVLGLNQD